MSIGRISGAMLYENLERQGIDLRFEGDLIYLDVNDNQNSQDGRVGIKTNSPAYDLDVNGEARIGTLLISGSSITSQSGPVDLGAVTDVTISGGTSNYVLTTDGNGVLRWSDVGSLSQLTGTTGMNIVLGTPTDGSLTEYASWDRWTDQVKVTDAIDDLNQIALNIAKGTYVGEVDFTANVVSGASPMTVQFASTATGTPTNYYWDFGDGNVVVAGSTVEHVYDDEDGGQFTVRLVAYNTQGTLTGNLDLGARGSADQQVKSDYITLYTPNPIPTLSLISDIIDDNDPTGLVITNFSEYADSYEIDWGDGTTTTLTKLNGGIQIDNDGRIVYDINTKGAIWADDGSGTDVREHQYINDSGDTKYDLILSATSDTAGPSPVTIESDPYPIYVHSEHTSSFTANTLTAINEQSTSGGVIRFTNTTATNPGPTSVFENNRYRWVWGDGSESTIDIDPSVEGNPGLPITHTFALSAEDQVNGVTQTFTISLEVVNENSKSPFESNVTVTVEPDVRADFSLSATTVSDRAGDSSNVGYVFTDYNGKDRSEFTFTTTSQNADTYEWTWGDGTASGTINEGAAGTTTGGTITHSYTSTGTKTVRLDIDGTPGTIAQTDTESRAVTILSNPAAPSDLGSKTLSMSTAGQGTNAKLAYDATNNSGGAMPSAGTTVTRYISGTITSSTVTDANTSVSGTLVSKINNAVDGSVTFDTSSNKSGTYDSLVVTDDRDAHLAISSLIYPTGFYKVFDAQVSTSVTSVPVGYNTFQLSHDVAGSTNSVGFVRDDLTAVPSVDTSLATLTEKTAGIYRYISGVPYYNTGGVVTVSGIVVDDWIGQTYYDGNPLTVADGDNLESTTGALISSQSKSYSDIDGAMSFLTSGIPNADTGHGTPYTLGNFDININGVARAAGYLNVSMANVNGISTVQQINTPINVYSQSITGVNEESIPVAPIVGSGTYSDAGKRVIVDNTGGPSDATPAFDSTINYYTARAFTGATTIAGTNEAVTRWGVIKNITTDFTDYLPAGPDLSTGRTGYQYFTFAFRRSKVNDFDINIDGKISGLWIAAPGTEIDSTSSLNGWLDATLNHTGSGVPGANPVAGASGSDGCAVTTSDRIPTGVAINGSYTMTLGTEDLSHATGNVCLIRIQLATTDYVNSISIGDPT